MSQLANAKTLRNAGRRGVKTIALVALVVGAVAAAAVGEAVVDASKGQGPIRALHGVNSGPVNDGGTLDLSAQFREFAPPLVRLHDCHWPNPDVVDIHVVFPDFRAEASRPESYDFDRTDDYLQSIVAVGSGIVYRLGESIEHSKKKYHVHPPADPEKWAEICLGIIRHYNEGWARGFHHDIRYWEIWNEPENRPACWTGSDEDYFRLYSITAKAIKARFPQVLVGGPAVGYSGQIRDGRFEPSAFLLAFLEHCRRDAAPLDFFSWHIYTNDPQAPAERAREIRRLLDQYGFAKTESHLNEWNYLPGNDWSGMLSPSGIERQRWCEEIGGPAGAAFTAATLITLQDAPLDAANYFAANTLGMGLFNAYGVPKKTFFAMKAFKGLLDTPERVSVEGDLPEGVAVCAGLSSDRRRMGILVANPSLDRATLRLRVRNLPWTSGAAYQVLRVDAGHDLAPVRSGDLPVGGEVLELDVPGCCVDLIRLGRE